MTAAAAGPTWRSRAAASAAKAITRRMHETAEDLTAATFERVDRLGSELRTEMDQRFAAAHAVVRVAFRDVRLDIADLRSRL